MWGIQLVCGINHWRKVWNASKSFGLSAWRGAYAGCRRWGGLAEMERLAIIWGVTLAVALGSFDGSSKGLPTELATVLIGWRLCSPMF